MASRLIKISKKEYKYKFQILNFKNNEWKQLVRIDNSTHFGKPEQHIHLGKKVKKINIKLEDIEQYLIKLAQKLMGDKNENPSS